MDELKKLASLIHQKNAIDAEITSITQRPALIGHTGEYIASRVFDIQLEESAVAKGIDGRFQSSPLSGKTVNIKWYGKRENILDISEFPDLDYYLVLTGPQSPATSSRGKSRPWVIKFVYLFDARVLLESLTQAGLHRGIATSVRNGLWESAEIYPRGNNPVYSVSEKQRSLISLFSQE